MIATVEELFEKTTSLIRPDLSSASMFLAEGTLRGSTHRSRINFLVMFLDLEFAVAMIKTINIGKAYSQESQNGSHTRRE